MKTIIKLTLIVLLVTPTTVLAEADTNTWNTGWSEQEAVLAKAVAIRAKRLEQLSGITFSKDWKPIVHLTWLLDGRNTEGQYVAETREILFKVHVWTEINVRHKTQLHLMDPAVLANDEVFGELADHELGHALCDDVNRKINGKPYFLVQYFNSLSHDYRMGLNIISEGVGRYFQVLRHPSDAKISKFYLPGTLQEGHLYDYDTITLLGGSYVVSDVLSRYGQLGLEYLVSHEFDADSKNMRGAAVSYRDKALLELSKVKSALPVQK
jgi:hypothetical protein